MSIKKLQSLFFKTLDVIYTSVVYFLICSLIGGITEFIWLTQEKNFIDNTSTSTLYVFLCLHVVILSLLFFLCRSIVRSIGSPFDRSQYKYAEWKEMDGGIVAGFTLFLLCPTIFDMAHTLRVRLWDK